MSRLRLIIVALITACCAHDSSRLPDSRHCAEPPQGIRPCPVFVDQCDGNTCLLIHNEALFFARGPWHEGDCLTELPANSQPAE